MRYVSLLILSALLMPAMRLAAQTATPPAPGIPLPTDDIAEAFATANAGVVVAPDDLDAPSGVPLLPDEDGAPMFAYTKWFMSPSNAEQYAGPFAPIIHHLGLFLTATIALIGVYALVWTSQYLFKWVAWLYTWFLKFVQLLLQLLGVLIANPIVLAVVVVLVGFSLIIVTVALIFQLDLSGLFGG